MDIWVCFLYHLKHTVTCYQIGGFDPSSSYIGTGCISLQERQFSSVPPSPMAYSHAETHTIPKDPPAFGGCMSQNPTSFKSRGESCLRVVGIQNTVHNSLFDVQGILPPLHYQ